MNCEEEYISNLNHLDFQIENQDGSSIFFVDKQLNYIEQEISPYIILGLEKAKDFKADAVYFRFFGDERPPLAQMYIYDNILNKRTKEEYLTIHREVWSACEVQLYLVIDKTEIKIFDGRKPNKIIGNKNVLQPIDTIDLTMGTQNDIIKKYRAQLFDNGAFWESEPASNHFLYNTSATVQLIKSLQKVRQKFKLLIGGNPEFSDRVLIMCILIKYLEENGVDPETEKNLAHDFFCISTGCKTLAEILYQNKLSELLTSLSLHFNGGIFSIINSNMHDILTLPQKELGVFFDAGKSENLFGWSEYSFKHIPVELISNLYEEFLPKENNKKGKAKHTPENGAVYTPSFLVNLLVDECLPLNFKNTNENIKLIDPACGSGIFLVSAYKRLVQRWRIKNRANKKLADPSPEALKEILKNNIFGIDIHYNSVHLTVFSLQLTLCSLLKPKQIWTTKGLFNDLIKGGNIIETDFFDYLSEAKFKRDFDLVIGNPPFEELSRVNFTAYERKLEQFVTEENLNLQIPRFQSALLFLSTSFLLLNKETGKLCLIMKSGPLLYSGGENTNILFRASLFEKYTVTQIIDFTLLKNIFKADVETAVIFMENKPSQNESITHIVVRESRSVVEKSYFELSHYDFYEIPFSIAITTPYIWKCNLFGGMQVYSLVERLKNNQSLRDYLEAKKTQGWDYGQGYIVGNKKKKDADGLINKKNTVVDKFFIGYNIGEIKCQDETHFKTIPVNAKNIFSPPHLLIKKTIGESIIPLALRDDYLTFKNEILGIHCPPQYYDELLLIEKMFKNNNNLLRFFIAATSARAGVNRSMYTTNLSDLLSIPILKEGAFMINSYENIIIEDIVKYYIEEFGKGNNSLVHKKMADVDKHIKPFSEIYCESLNKIYANKEGEKYHFSKLTEGDAFFACEYKFGKEADYAHEYSNENLDSLLFAWNPSRSIKYSKVIRIYEDNVIRFVKPKKLMFWLKSIALRDCNDTLEDALREE